MKAVGKISLVLLMWAGMQSALAQDAQTIVETHCKACHQAGVGGAPMLEDKASWAPRLASGSDAMLATVLAGKGAMPKKGTCMSCTDDDLRAAIDLLTAAVR